MPDPTATDAISAAVAGLAGIGVKSLVDYLKESKRDEAISSLRDRMTRTEERQASFADALTKQSQTAHDIATDIRKILVRLGEDERG